MEENTDRGSSSILGGLSSHFRIKVVWVAGIQEGLVIPNSVQEYLRRGALRVRLARHALLVPGQASEHHGSTSL